MANSPKKQKRKKKQDGELFEIENESQKQDGSPNRNFN